MKKVSLFSTATVASIVATTVVAVPAFACHPVGNLVKQVEDQTTNSGLVDANTADSALTVNTGDTLVYVITVNNTGATASNGDDDMLNTTVTDALPSGVELVGTAPKLSLGTIAPGKSVTVKYTVKVTDTTDGDVITNRACFNGNSKDNKDNQSNCDTAVVKVHVPSTPTQPTTPTTPSAPVTTLPDTGSTALSAGLFVSGGIVLGYAANVLRLKFRNNA